MQRTHQDSAAPKALLGVPFATRSYVAPATSPAALTIVHSEKTCRVTLPALATTGQDAPATARKTRTLVPTATTRLRRRGGGPATVLTGADAGCSAPPSQR
ncbi:hypothetical protein TAE01_12370 [Terrabacter aerolatus]|uniref:Uncharacterized protein n=1 Tax=Terrabacter aerolatus TaxID=422442 RepID=A0A512CZ14_9MICO|nr:hypothetical protein TAE01_12370 [Terrabacter aerolatus]